MKKKIQDLIALYGKLALIIYFTIFILVFFGFYFALQAGVDLAGGASPLVARHIMGQRVSESMQPKRG